MFLQMCKGKEETKEKCIRNFLGVREIPYIQPIIEVLSVSITLLTRDTTLIIHIDM